jgi:hypothetical protein
MFTLNRAFGDLLFAKLAKHSFLFVFCWHCVKTRFAVLTLNRALSDLLFTKWTKRSFFFSYCFHHFFACCFHALHPLLKNVLQMPSAALRYSVFSLFHTSRAGSRSAPSWLQHPSSHTNSVVRCGKPAVTVPPVADERTELGNGFAVGNPIDKQCRSHGSISDARRCAGTVNYAPG